MVVGCFNGGMIDSVCGRDAGNGEDYREREERIIPHLEKRAMKSLLEELSIGNEIMMETSRSMNSMNRYSADSSA